ncbi:MAG: [LysW]-lysine hydrolase [Phycisphaerales bacterium]|nr:[LysW]-lysine hydrolase [Phycisphaerales bacterium]
MSQNPDQSIEEQVLIDLVSTPSLSGEEANAAQVFSRYANQLGYKASIDQVGNAIADRGETECPKRHIVLLGHIDTVPGDIPVRVEDRVLYGRGSVDAKGPLAAMLVAASRIEVPEQVRVSVVAAVGEEAAESIGANHIVHQWNPDACIIGEPSGWDGVTLGYKGRLLADVVVVSSNAHSAGPDGSASDDLFTWWTQCLSQLGEINSQISSVINQIQSTILNLETQNDGFEEKALMTIGFRLPTTHSPEDVQELLNSCVIPGMKISYSGSIEASMTGRNDAVVRSISAAIRSNGGRPMPKKKTGTADLNVVAPIWGCPIAAYGPGDSSLDHTPNEHIHLDELSKSVDVLEVAIKNLIEELLDQEVVQTKSESC